MKSLEETFQILTDERANHISTYLRAHHDQFRLLSHKSAGYFNTLKTNLPDDFHDLLFQYEEHVNYLHSISQDLIYKQGLKDGAGLVKYLFFKQVNDSSK